MAIPFKRMGRKDPRKVDGVVKYHPQLVTQGQSVDLDKLAYTMKEKSSLSLGDIQSVLTNLVEAMRTALFDGKSVNIHDFGVFSLHYLHRSLRQFFTYRQKRNDIVHHDHTDTCQNIRKIQFSVF